MKYTIRAVFSVIGLLLCAPGAEATDAHNNYMILGPGAYTCQRIVSDLARDAKDNNPASVIVYSNWLAGELTAYNRDTKGNYSITGDSSFTEVFAWTVQYCQKHPSHIYASAAEALITKLKSHRQTSMPQPKDESDESDKDESGKDDDNTKDDEDDGK